MKKSFSRIWGVGLVLVILASLLLSAVPVSAGELAWGRYDDPTNTTNQLTTVAGLDIVDIAVASDGQTVYVATAALGSKIYKSINGGKTFSGVTTTLGTVNMIAVAPDNKDLIVAVDATAGALVAHVSTNAGSSFTNIAAPAGGVATDVAISALDGSKRYIALSGAATTPIADNDDARLLYFDLGSSVPAWVDAVAGAAWDNGAGLGTYFGGAQAEIDAMSAVAFSPYFSSDLTAVAVSYQFGGVALQTASIKFHILSFNQKKWDVTAGFTGYPFAIKSAAAAADVFTVAKVDISLDPSYLGGDDSLRVAFVAASIVTPAATVAGGLWRLKDTTVKNLVEATDMFSVSWNGVNLVAGSTDSNTIRRSADAMASSPSISTTSSLKRPGISAVANNTVVAWAGANVVAGLSGNESSFGISTDNSATFKETALIDTAWTTVSDFLVSADGSVVYVLTNDAVDTSLWKKEGSDWARVWVLAGNAGYIVRGPKDNKDVLYIADTTGTNMWYTDTGATKWFPRASRYAIADLAVESIDVAYVAVNAANSVSKTTNKGFTWGDSKSTSLSGADTIWSITVLAKDKLIVGGNLGYISYSVDGNANWTNISTQLNGALMAVATALTLDTGDFIYAGTTGNTLVERWEIGTSTSWRNLTSVPLGTAPTTTRGIGLSEGALYVLTSDGVTDSSIARTLDPTALNPTWSDTGAVALDQHTTIAPNALRMSTGSTQLWLYANVTSQDARVYTDTLNTVKPVVTAPATIKTNPASGIPYSVDFSWARPHAATTVATTYQLQVADNEAFNGPIVNNAAVVAASTSGTPAVNVATGAMPGVKYYYRLRVSVDGPLHSNYSATGSFTVTPLENIPTQIINPTPAVVIPPAPVPVINLPAPIINLPAPQQIVIPAPQQIVIPPAPAPPAPIAPAYIWAVVIIGAVLVIAVIILIVRTRRTV